jgi:hypothetical protein
MSAADKAKLDSLGNTLNGTLILADANPMIQFGSSGWTLSADAANGLTLYSGGKDFTLNSGNLKLANGCGVKVNGVQVLGGQRPAIANTDTNTTNLAAALNAVLSALRTHGLIAT